LLRKQQKTLWGYIFAARCTYHLHGTESFKVINADNSKKHITRACYDKQHVCAYLQLFSR